MPKGWYMKATPDIIIEQGPLPCKKWIKNRRLPVLQLTDLDILGSSRGMSSTVMDKIAYGQIAHNNLWIQALMNHAYFTPKLLLQKGSLDMNQIRQSDRNILVYGKSQAKPELLVQEIVGQSTLLLMDRLKDQILKVANVMPVTRGESIPNVESRQMLDFMKDQETLQSVPKDVKHSRFLQDWAAIAFELMAEKYRQTPERIFQYFGKLKRKEIVTIAGDDIDVDVDISVDIINGMSGTLSGRMQHIQQLLTLVPNYYTPAEIIEQLEIGSPEKIYDEVTSATEAARDDIASILSGKEVPSPSRLNDLLTYYDVYIQEIQKKEIKALLPEVFDENGKDIGNKLLSQILVIETELLNIMNDVGMEMPNGAVIKKGDMPLLMAHLNVPPGTTLHQYVYGRHPTFPCLYKDSQEDLNPFKIAEDAQREMESAQIQAQNSANFGSDQGAQGVK